jgi:hypothetical protein
MSWLVDWYGNGQWVMRFARVEWTAFTLNVRRIGAAVTFRLFSYMPVSTSQGPSSVSTPVSLLTHTNH